LILIERLLKYVRWAVGDAHDVEDPPKKVSVCR
jgi:hypothetical protein